MPSGHDVRRGVWRLADPKISLASFAGMFLGACAAAADGPVSPGWLTLTVLATFSLEVGKNASGEVFDYDSGADLAVAEADRSPFSGGKRVLVDGLLTRRVTWLVAGACFGLGAALGLILVVHEPGVLALGAIGVACAFFYHAPPLQLAYRGLGELVVGLCYGPGIVGGTYLVQRNALPWRVVALGLPLGLLVAAFLWINEFPDYRADRSAGKRNLVVRLGRRRAARAFAILLAIGFLTLALVPLAGWSPGVLLGLVGLAPATAAARTALRHPEETPRLAGAQSATLVAFLLTAVGSGVGLASGL